MHYNNTSDIQSDYVTLASENGRHQDPQMLSSEADPKKNIQFDTCTSADTSEFRHT